MTDTTHTLRVAGHNITINIYSVTNEVDMAETVDQLRGVGQKQYINGADNVLAISADNQSGIEVTATGGNNITIDQKQTSDWTLDVMDNNSVQALNFRDGWFNFAKVDDYVISATQGGLYNFSFTHQYTIDRQVGGPYSIQWRLQDTTNTLTYLIGTDYEDNTGVTDRAPL